MVGNHRKKLSTELQALKREKRLSASADRKLRGVHGINSRNRKTKTGGPKIVIKSISESGRSAGGSGEGSKEAG